MEEKKEYILCAANHYDDGKKHKFTPKNIKTGFVICGRRHHNCISTFALMVGFPYSEESQKLHNTEIQGFLTNTDRFVDRNEAFDIAEQSGQIKKMEYKDKSSRSLLSEDLY